MDTADLHAKILTFLRGELALSGYQIMVALELELAPANRGWRPQQLKKWIRQSQPELFEGGAETEKLVSQIIQMADADSETQPPGKYRYIIRTQQYLEGRSTFSFSLSPTYRGESDDESTALIGASGQKMDPTSAATVVLGKHAGDLMRINGQMFDTAVKYSGQQMMHLLEQNSKLMDENFTLRREVDDLRSTRMEREYALGERAEKMAQGSKQFDKIMQLGTIVASKVLGDGGGGGTTPVGMLLHTFRESLTQQQQMQLGMMLSGEQRLMLLEIMGYASTPDAEKQRQQPDSQTQPPQGHATNGQAAK